MRLLELFDTQFTSMRKEVTNAVLDILTPFAAHGETEVAMQTVVSRLNDLAFGIEVTSDTIKSCIDPNNTPMVSHIDDGTIYLNGTQPDAGPEMPDEPQEPADPVGDSAKKQASASLDTKPPLKLP
jgi:hypothetical protein